MYDVRTMTTATTVIFPHDGDVEVDGDKSLVHNTPYSEHSTGSVETDNLQRAGQTNPIVSINGSH